jgi:hypothetical protein
VVVSIEMFVDLKTLTVEELIGRLWAVEERFEDKTEAVTDKMGRLMMAEEDWMEKHKHRFLSGSKPGGSGAGGGAPKNKAAARSDGGASKPVKLTSEGTPRRKGRCRNCGIYGHWEQDCKRPRKDKKKEQAPPEANIAVGGGDQVGALMLATCDIMHGSSQCVHLMEKKVIPADIPNGVWVLDTGASNHMTGSLSALSQLDSSVQGTVKFGDGSTVRIKGMGSIIMQDRNQNHKVLTEVYYIPELKSNIVSLGQLEEKGFRYVG